MLSNKFTTLKERLAYFIAQKKEPEAKDYSLVLLHEKIDALAEYQQLQFYKPKMKDYLGISYLGVFKVRKRGKR